MALSLMLWNWQQPNWPNFTYDSTALETLEQQFLLRAGEFVGVYRHIAADDRDTLKIELIGDEAVGTSAIEGEILNRDSVQSSLRHQFGIGAERPGISSAERGIARMMADLYRSFAAPLTDRMLFEWHAMLMSGDARVTGGYRTHAEPMQVVSGPDYKRSVHFEAPPSARVPDEMARFIGWFNETAPNAGSPLPALARAGTAHLFFVSVHPFEDGNGRIGRSVAEKSLAQSLGQPSMIALAYTIQRKRNAYYDALERNNKTNEITGWLSYFAETILDAQRSTIRRVDFYIAKAKFYERLRGNLNQRQEKAIRRMFSEGIDGFKGGLSAENYVSITGATRATTTRDLQDLVEKGALTRTGERRYTRYHLDLAART